jgi:F-type H+-transporting ATPase subunit alpha
VNVGLSVSRVGGDAQTRAMKQVAGRLRLDMAAFRELAAFAQFGSDLDKATQYRLSQGQKLQEILKQPQYEPVRLDDQIITIYAGTRGFTDDVPVERVPDWEQTLTRYMEASHPEIGKAIITQGHLSDEIEAKLQNALTTFMSTWN